MFMVGLFCQFDAYAQDAQEGPKMQWHNYKLIIMTTHTLLG